MNTMLECPASDAPAQDWRLWLAELRELPQNAAVKNAMLKAQKMLSAKREKPRKSEATWRGDPDCFA